MILANDNLLTFLLRMQSGPTPLIVRHSDGTVFNYADIDSLSARIAGVLKYHGLSFGDRICVQAEKSVEAFAVYLAALRLGAIYIPLNPAYTDVEVSYFASDAKPKLFVSSPERSRVLAQRLTDVEVLTLAIDGTGSLTDEAATIEPFQDIALCRADDIAAILYTSGTTGRAKGAMMSHGNLLANARDLAACWSFTSHDILLHALPIYHTHGLFVAMNVVMLSGASALYLPRFDADQVIAAIPAATAMMGVPTFYTRLLDHPALSQDATRHIRLFISGSAPLLAETHITWSARTGHKILERYGMTETGILTSNPYDGDRRPGTVGLALPSVALRVVDATSGSLVPAGTIGSVEVRGPGVFAGYWQRPERIGDDFRPDGYFITGDVGFLTEDGYLTIVGRDKDVVISGGFNIYPKEVEEIIDAFEGVLENAVVGIPDKHLGEVPAAVVVLQIAESLTENDLLDHLSGSLARFKLPRLIAFAAELPRNSMGKVQKTELRKWLDAATQQEAQTNLLRFYKR